MVMRLITIIERLNIVAIRLKSIVRDEMCVWIQTQVVKSKVKMTIKDIRIYNKLLKNIHLYLY